MPKPHPEPVLQLHTKIKYTIKKLDKVFATFYRTSKVFFYIVYIFVNEVK
jgi:hypothetical protein